MLTLVSRGVAKRIFRYPQIYSSLLIEYKDSRMAINLWEGIAKTLGRKKHYAHVAFNTSTLAPVENTLYSYS